MPAIAARKTASKKRIVIWNALGSAAYALSSLLLLIIVVRVCGGEEGGVFSIGYAIAQLMLTVGAFDSTTFFATDAEGKISYEQFLAFKITTCLFMVIASVVYITYFDFGFHKMVVAYSLCLYRLFEAAAQYWYAAFQKQERLDIAGFSTMWRMVLSTVVFAVLIFLKKDVVMAVVASSAVEAIWIAAYDIPRLRMITKISWPDFSIKPLMALFISCAPLFASTFLSTYLSNICKYAIESVGTEQMQTVFNILFMPSFVINLFMIFFIRPSLTKMAVLWMDKKIKPFMVIVAKLLALALGVTIIASACCAVIGIPVLEIMYSTNLQGNATALVLVMIGGGLLSASNVFYYCLVVIRGQIGVLVGYGLTILMAQLISFPLVSRMAIFGASVSYALSCLGLLLIFAIIFACVILCKLKRSA